MNKKIILKAIFDSFFQVIALYLFGEYTTSVYSQDDTFVQLLFFSGLLSIVTSIIYYCCVFNESDNKNIIAISLISFFLCFLLIAIAFISYFAMPYDIMQNKELNNADGLMVIFNSAVFIILSVFIKIIIFVVILIRNKTIKNNQGTD